MSEMAKQLLDSFEIEDVKNRLAQEDLGNINEDGELWFAYEGLKKATRILENHFLTQKENYEKDIELLNFKVNHFSGDIKNIQKSLQEEKDTNDALRQEIIRLTSEKKVIASLNAKISELEKENLDLQGSLYEQSMNMPDKGDRMFNHKHHYLEEEEMSEKLHKKRTKHENEEPDGKQIQEAGLFLKEQNEMDSQKVEKGCLK
ncbi:hypothetical protein AB205_0174090 [Aquarana catesbeiana]|uniref:Uncharacterized protein n=1 Tax=Aquarana catesbeiana TaxID=8400 RepID=A0A2G9RND2_AQUCT|nr:hypothetical protein AB205_0174090 [Aquarana catesbeiana]